MARVAELDAAWTDFDLSHYRNNPTEHLENCRRARTFQTRKAGYLALMQREGNLRHAYGLSSYLDGDCSLAAVCSGTWTLVGEFADHGTSDGRYICILGAPVSDNTTVTQYGQSGGDFEDFV